jgi:uncharacterized protein YjdB
MRWIPLAFLALVGASAGCNLLTSSCQGDVVRVQSFLPGDTTVKVGAQYTVTFRISECGGTAQLYKTPSWASEDTMVVRVDAQSGAVSAVGIGRSRLSVRTLEGGTFGAGTVTVVP